MEQDRTYLLNNGFRECLTHGEETGGFAARRLRREKLWPKEIKFGLESKFASNNVDCFFNRPVSEKVVGKIGWAQGWKLLSRGNRMCEVAGLRICRFAAAEVASLARRM